MQPLEQEIPESSEARNSWLFVTGGLLCITYELFGTGGVVHQKEHLTGLPL